MGIGKYTSISDKIDSLSSDKYVIDLDDYVHTRSARCNSRYKVLAISDFSYSSITNSNSMDPAANRRTMSITDLISQLKLKGGFPKSYNKKRYTSRYSFINVLDPEKRLGGECKINRKTSRYTNNTFESPFKPYSIRCIGNYFDCVMSYFVMLSKYTSIEISHIKHLRFDKLDVVDMAKRSMGVGFPNLPHSTSIKINQKLVKMTKDRLDLLRFMEKIMPPDFFHRFLYVVRVCACLESSALEDHGHDEGKTVALAMSYEKTDHDIDIGDLDESLYDIESIENIDSIVEYNAIKEIVRNILLPENRKIFEEHCANDCYTHLNVYCVDVEADWVIIALTHVFKSTRVYTRDSDILVLGQSHTFQPISHTCNRLLIINIIKMMCRTNNTPGDLFNIIILLFSTGSDYYNYYNFGKMAFVNTVIKIGSNLFGTKHVDFEQMDIINGFLKNAKSRHSACSFIRDAIICLVKCLDFYWKNDIPCGCSECVYFDGNGIEV